MIHALRPAFVKAASNAPMLFTTTAQFQNRVITYPPRNLGPFQPRREFCAVTMITGSTLALAGVHSDEKTLIQVGSFLFFFGLMIDC